MKSKSFIIRQGIYRIMPLLIYGMLTMSYSSVMSQCLPHTIAANEPGAILYACAADGKPDFFTFSKSDTTKLKYAFIVADGADNLLYISQNPTIDFNGANIAFFRVWGMVYSDSLIFRVGQDVSTIMPTKGCARLSENVIRIVRDIPEALDASLINGSRDTTICVNNNRSDTLFFAPPTNANSKQLFLVTKLDGTIIDFFKGNSYSIEFLSEDVYSIYNLNYTGALTLSPNQSNVFRSTLSNGCFKVGAQSVTLDLTSISGGTLLPLSQQSSFCPSGTNNIFFIRNTNGSAPSTAIIVLDENNICKRTSIGTSVMLDGLSPGDYTLRALDFSGRLLILPGDTISFTNPGAYSNDCYAWSSGSISITISVPQAGKIISSTGDTALFACPGDRLPDRLFFNASGIGSSRYAILIVNEKNKIIGVTTLGGFFDFEGSPLGICRAYGLSYTGVLLATVDSFLNSRLSSDCFEITKNYINIVKGTIKGGTISIKGGKNEYFVCPEKDSISKILFDRKNSSPSLYQFVLTTESGNILDFIENDSVRFKNLTFPSMRIYGVAYSGKRQISRGSNLFFSSFSEGCYSISENFVKVVNETPRGGGVRLPDGSNKELFCPSEPGKKTLQFRNVDVSNNPYAFVITDSVMKVIDITPNFSYSFDSLPLGQYFVFGVSYIGQPLISKGSILKFNSTFNPFSDVCFSYSQNNIEVVIGQINGGMLTSSEGSTIVFTCPSNLDQDNIQIIPQFQRSLGYRYVLTNNQNIIVGYSVSDQIDFGTSPINEVTRVYGVAYKGDFIGALNRNVLETAFSTGCYDLSDNYVLVKQIAVPPHRLIYSSTDSVITICVGDSKADTIRLSTSDSIGLKTVFLGVENGKISRIYTSKVLEFEKDSIGFLKLYSLIYTGKLLVKEGNSFLQGSLFSDDCFSLSSNFLSIDKVNKGPFCVITAGQDFQYGFGLKLFPNPSRGSKINLEWHLKQTIYQGRQNTVKITDMQGRVVSLVHVLAKEYNTIQLSLPNLPKGVYLVSLRAGNIVHTEKLVIVN